MEVTNSKSLNVNSAETQSSSAKSQKTENNNQQASFSDELKNIKSQEAEKAPDTDASKKPETKDKKVNNALGGLNETIKELNGLNKTDESNYEKLREQLEALGIIDKNIGIKELFDQYNLQMNKDIKLYKNGQLKELLNVKNNNKINLQEMTEQLTVKNNEINTKENNEEKTEYNKTKTIESESGIHKFDTKSNIIVDTIVSYENVVMDKADVDFFINLTNKGILNINDIQGAEKSARVSKTLADLLVKAMNDNKPIRIDFDNDISVIIKIDKAGKISADFLPSSQVAEAYLKENLPLLKQRFDDNNLEYNEFNQRQRKQNNQENKKKEGKDE